MNFKQDNEQAPPVNHVVEVPNSPQRDSTPPCVDGSFSQSTAQETILASPLSVLPNTPLARRGSATPSRIIRKLSCTDGYAEEPEKAFAPCYSPLVNFRGKDALNMGIRPAMAVLATQLDMTPASSGFHAFALEPATTAAPGQKADHAEK